MKTEQLILQKLDHIEREVHEIREHVIDEDTLLTKEDKKLLDESFSHEKEGSLISLEELENVRNKTG